MAQILMAEYHLPTLKLRLNPAAQPPEIVCELELSVDDARVVEQTWRCSTEEVGLPARLEAARRAGRGYTMRLPDYVVDGVRDWIWARDPDGPLWLHLVKPIGFLALVPWEEILQPRVGVPILRVPDFLSDPPSQSPHRLEVVLCSSMPAAKESFALAQHLAALSAGILSIATARTRRIHIFTDRQLVDEVRYRLGQVGLSDEQVIVHDPALAAAYGTPAAVKGLTESATRIDNPWLLWMLDALRGRSVDVVHFISHGYLSHDQGALAFAQSPVQNEDVRLARFVGATQLGHFLTQVGAWSVFFTAPEFNFSEWGLRLLADNIAQSRPGPLVYHELRLDPQCDMAAAAYNFLFCDGGAPPPATPALFTYCHPARLLDAEAAQAMPLRAAKAYSLFEAAPELETLPDEEMPTWVAATERYIEQRVRDMDQVRATGETPVREENMVEVEKILAEVRDIVAKAASQSSPGDDV